MEPLDIICWKWYAGLHPKKRMLFGADHVNTLHSMLKRHVHIPFRLICITDDAVGIERGIKILPLWNDYRYKGGCFVRLKIFAPGFPEGLGISKRFCSIDLDCVITQDITPLLTTPDDFLIWGDPSRKALYCGSFWVMKTGSRPQVWQKFDPDKYPMIDGKYRLGTDQAVLTDILGPNEKMVGKSDGVLKFSDDIKPSDKLDAMKFNLTQLAEKRDKDIAEGLDKIERIVTARAHRLHYQPEQYWTELEKEKGCVRAKFMNKYKSLVLKYRRHIRLLTKGKSNGFLPKDARIVFFNGKEDPSNIAIQRSFPWIQEHYK